MTICRLNRYYSRVDLLVDPLIDMIDPSHVEKAYDHKYLLDKVITMECIDVVLAVLLACSLAILVSLLTNSVLVLLTNKKGHCHVRRYPCGYQVMNCADASKYNCPLNLSVKTTPKSLESFLPADAELRLLSDNDNKVYYTVAGKLYKLTRLDDIMARMSKMDIDHTIIKMERYGTWDLIHTEDDRILFIDNGKVVTVNNNIGGREVNFKGMYEGVFISEQGVAYHLGEMEVERFHPTLELATELDINLVSFQEIKIDKSNGNVWSISNSKGIRANKMN